MATRKIRKTAILLKTETTYGVDAVPTGAANAMLVSNVEINPLNAENVPRDLIRSYFGASEELVGSAFVTMAFDVELQGSGALGVAPAWGAALKSTGWAETITAANRVDYTLLSDAQESSTIYWYDDGVLHKGFGGFGGWTWNTPVGGRPTMRLNYILIDGGISAIANPATTLTLWKTPQVVTDANTGDVTLGGTYAAGAITGGVPYPSRGLAFESGNAVNYTELLGGSTVDISDRNVSGSVEFDLTAAQEVSFMALVKANTLQSFSLQHGTTVGLKVLMFAPKVQLKSPSKAEINGKRLIGYALTCVPDAGNDEFRIVCI